MTTQTTITIKASHYRALIATMPTNDRRQHLNGFHLDAKHGVAVATDGHALVRVPMTVEGELTENVTLRLVERFTIPRTVETVTIHLDSMLNDASTLQWVTRKGDTVSRALRHVDGEFLDWERITDLREAGSGATVERFCVNPPLISRVTQALDAQFATIEFTGKGSNGPLVVTMASEPDVLCIVMQASLGS